MEFIDIAQALISDGGEIDEQRASKVKIQELPAREFARLERAGWQVECIPIVGISKGSNDFILLNRAQFGDQRGQLSVDYQPYGVLHELTELGIIRPGQKTRQLAHRVYSAVSQTLANLDEESRERFSLPHLTALAAEYRAALLTGRTKEEGLREAGRVNSMVLKALNEKPGQGGFTPDGFARRFVFKKVVEEFRENN